MAGERARAVTRGFAKDLLRQMNALSPCDSPSLQLNQDNFEIECAWELTAMNITIASRCAVFGALP